MVLVIMGIGLALMVGIINLRRALSLVGGVVLLLVLSPFVESLIGSLPWWITSLLVVMLGLSLLRAVSNALIGRGASDHMVGNLAADVVRGGFRLLIWSIAAPFRALTWALGRR
jgi:hypothetical protein